MNNIKYIFMSEDIMWNVLVFSTSITQEWQDRKCAARSA